MKQFLLSILCSFCICVSVSAQQKDFSIAEYNLNTIYSKLSRFASEEDNVKNNAIFLQMLDSVLKIPESFHYQFSSLNMGIVTAPDQTFRIFTWFIVHTNGTYETFGILQRYFKVNNSVKTTKGTEVTVRKVAPLGDPIEVTVRGYELSIRKADAEMVEVI